MFNGVDVFGRLQFGELSPRFSIENKRIMAEWISLLGSLRNRSKWPLKSSYLLPRDKYGGGQSGQEDYHSPGDLSTLRRQRIPKASEPG